MTLYCCCLCGVLAFQHQLITSERGLHITCLGHSTALRAFLGKGTERELTANTREANSTSLYKAQPRREPELHYEFKDSDETSVAPIRVHSGAVTAFTGQ